MGLQKQQQSSQQYIEQLPSDGLPSRSQFAPNAKAYHGTRHCDGSCSVWVEAITDSNSAHNIKGARTPLPLHLELRNHSPTGFAWGYGGSGPAQLALALLMDATQDQTLALRHYQDFKFHYVAGWGNSWSITSEEIKAFLVARENLAGCECAVNSCPDC